MVNGYLFRGSKNRSEDLTTTANITDLRGARVASFFWVQSMVSVDNKCTVLFDMDMAIHAPACDVGQGHDQIVALTGANDNLLRIWIDV